jgi:hypothetical protein
MTQTAAEVFRDYETAGVPASGSHQPVKAEIRALLGMYEQLFGSIGLGYATFAQLAADLNHDANTLAIVYGDPTPALNGIYVKSGASGSGSWIRVGDTPNDLIRLTVTGGTANAIVATATETPTVPGDKLYLLTPTAANTGPATINVNGTGAAAIRNALGSSLAANALLANIPVLMVWQVDHYHIMVSVPVDATGVLNDCLAARDAAQGYANSAAASASALGNQAHQYDTRTLAAAATIPAGINVINTYGLTTAGDGGGGTYTRGTPTSPGAFQDAGGNWWGKVAEAATGLLNYVKNGNFTFWRSGNTQTTAGPNSDDDWTNFHGAPTTKTHSIGVFAYGDTTVPGFPEYYSSTAVVTGATAAAYAVKTVTLGKVNDLLGKTITLTLWGSASATRNIAAEFYATYGSGGSPSPNQTLVVQTIPLTTTFGKKSYKITLPSMAGKTLGNNEDDRIDLNFWFDAGSTFNARTNSLGNQSGTFNIARVSVLEGDHTADADPWNKYERPGVGAAGFGRYRPTVAHVYSTIDFYRNPGTELPVGGQVFASWGFPGAALSASTHSIPVAARMKLVLALWHLIWNPNSASIGTAVRLVKADAGPTNVVAIKSFAVTTGSSPLNQSQDMTVEMRDFLLNPEPGTNRKTLGQQVFGDGTNGPKIYASYIECLWDVTPD